MPVPSSLFTLIDAITSQGQSVPLECDRMAALFKEQEQFVRHIQGSAARLLGCDNIDHKPLAGPQVTVAGFAGLVEKLLCSLKERVALG